MKHVKLIFILMTILFLAFPQYGLAKDTKNVGKIASVSGSVELKKSGGKKEFKAVRNMSVTQGDTISTGAKSKAVLHIDGDKEVTIAANTKLVIKQLVKSIKAEQGKTQLSLVGGKVKVKINKKLQGDSKFQVQTPNAIMGVMGTEFDVAYGNSETTIGVEEGIVSVIPTSAPSGTSPSWQHHDVYPQQITQVNGDGTTPPRQMTDVDRAFFTSDSDLSQEPATNEQNASSSQSIQYGPGANNDNSSSSETSGGGSDNSGGTSPTLPGDTTNPGDATDPNVPTDPGNTTDPNVPTDPGNTTDPNVPTDPGNTTDPNVPTDPGNTLDPNVPTDPGNTTDPNVPTDPGNTLDPNEPTEQERGLAEGKAAKEAYLIGVLTADGQYQAFSEIIEQNDELSQVYWDGESTGMMEAYNYTGDPTEDYTAGYDIGYAESFIEGYLQGFEMTHGVAPAIASYAIEDIVLFYQYYFTLPSDSEFDIGFMEGLASVNERDFKMSAEGINYLNGAYNNEHTKLTVLNLDGIHALGEEDGYISALFSLGYERGYGEGNEAGYAAGEASTP